MPLSEDDIREILRLIDESDAEELRIETEAFSLHLLRGTAAARGAEAEAPERREAEAAAAAVAPAWTEQAPAAAGEAVEAEADGAATDGRLTIRSPIVGTFYRAAAPGAPPFVDVGSHVEPDTTVCLIEVMKMMNPVPAGVSGTIVEVCAQNAEPVEAGAPLFRVRPQR